MELLAPAGSLEKIKYALAYGADAVYAAGKRYGLRAKAANLDYEELREAVRLCHSLNRKIYITLNIFAHNQDYADLPPYIDYLAEIGVDALIISDPGVFIVVKETAPDMAVHISTQANVTSWKSAEFWQNQGAKRIILARELTAKEIKEITTALPDMEFEIFCHGAMCISYSGRCLLSAFLNNRDANQGLCTHPCRWQYTLHEESRPGQFFPIEEDERGTYILNSKDLCLYDHLNRVLDLGVTSLKIEGRMKSIYYVANTVRVYKTALDILEAGKEPPSELGKELEKVSHRIYTSGFLTGYDETQFYQSSSYIREYQFLGEIVSVTDVYDREGAEQSRVTVKVRSKFIAGEEVEIIFPDYGCDLAVIPDVIVNSEGESIAATKPNTTVSFNVYGAIPDRGILRKKIDV
jgi:U32 family peptidase